MMWKDETKKGVVVSSTATIGPFKLVVHHYIGCPPELWFATCYGLFTQNELKGSDLAESKIRAMALLKILLAQAIREIEAA